MRLSRLLPAALFCLGLCCLATIPPRATLAQANARDLLAATGSGSAQRGKPSPTPTPTPDVTSTVYDTSSTGDPLLLQSDNLYASGAPGSAVYASGAGVISRIDSYGNSDWDLRLADSTRGFYLTLNPVSGSVAPGLPSGPTFYNGQLISRCFDPTGATTNVFSWFSISGANPNCAMRVNFNYLGNGYSLVMSPYQAGTGRAEVYCNAHALSDGSCVDWTILPNLSVSNATIANLSSINARNGKETLIGAYYLTFRVHVTAP